MDRSSGDYKEHDNALDHVKQMALGIRSPQIWKLAGVFSTVASIVLSL